MTSVPIVLNVGVFIIGLLHSHITPKGLQLDVLMVQKIDKGKIVWNVPTAEVEIGETPEAAMVRGTRAETNGVVQLNEDELETFVYDKDHKTKFAIIAGNRLQQSLQCHFFHHKKYAETYDLRWMRLNLERNSHTGPSKLQAIDRDRTFMPYGTPYIRLRGTLFNAFTNNRDVREALAHAVTSAHNKRIAPTRITHADMASITV